MEEELICGACNMAFNSTGLLEKHKALFCIGSEVGNLRVQRTSSDTVMRNNRGGVDPKQMRTPELVQMRGQRRNVIRWSVEAEPKSGRAEDKAATGQTDGAALQNLTDEASGRHLGHSERLKEMREMATLHERQLALIYAHNQQLELQRDELAHQVSVLSKQSNTTHLESLLMELREQEERNEDTLQQLAEHLHALHLDDLLCFCFLLPLFSVQKVSVPADQPDPGENDKMHHDNYKLISSVDGSLSTQITALRQAYMQSGGSDPAIVAQMIHLQAEAQRLEKNQPAASAKARKKSKNDKSDDEEKMFGALVTVDSKSLLSSNPEVKPPQRGTSWELLVLEQENQRLEEEILRIQLARERNHDYEGWTVFVIKHTALIFALQARSFCSPSGRCMTDPLDSLGPAPYDPAAGFVIFFDLVLGVDASQKALRLVAALYSEGQKVGPLTPLPPVQCLPGVSQPYTHGLTPGNCAVLSVKQPVPRIQPSLSLCLVVEVQAARDLDVYNQGVLNLGSYGWTRLELFDEYNQLRSGHWRVPVRSLPIKPSLSIAQLNSIPQVGNMELYVRLVNSRDGDVQTLTKPDLTSTRHYKFPAVVSSVPVTVHGNTALPVSAPQTTRVDQLSSLLTLTDNKNPPPTDETSQS
ncbi:coiled-coil domain-containing protein 17 [Lates calcarifer]|uniref:Coiled-coil domain-containing protein 17 n=1 Tax=Lates calcarifer TaxID=8187 RepID=A0AAJ8BHM6_LATCA|nr:coiled-coil domain-containing protein 17 [Lates calcarifer]